MGTHQQRKALICRLRKEIATTNREIYRLYSNKTCLQLALEELLAFERCYMVEELARIEDCLVDLS
jgi:hypothetical protein